MAFYTSRSKRLPAAKPAVEPLEDRCVLDGSFGPWGTPVNLGSVVNSAANDQHPAISPDGLSLYITSNRTDLPGAHGSFDLWVSHRATKSDPWGTPVNLGDTINGTGRDFSPVFSPDGHWLIYARAPGADENDDDLYITHRADKDNDFAWETPVSLGTNVNSAKGDSGPALFEDPATGLLNLYFTSNRPGGLGDWDIYHSIRQEDGTFTPAELVPEVSTAYRDVRTTIRGDGLEMIITSTNPAYLNPPPPNPQAPLDLYVSTRASTLDPWSKPVNLNDAGSPVNSTSPTVPDSAPYLSRDGKTLFFYSNRTDLEHHGGNDLFTCTREEIDGGEDGAIAAPTRTASQLVAPTPIVFVRGLLQAEPGNATLSGANHASANRPEEPVPSLLPNNSGLALGGVAAPSLADPTLDQRPVAPALDYFFAHHHGQAPSIGLDDEFDTPLGR